VDVTAGPAAVVSVLVTPAVAAAIPARQLVVHSCVLMPAAACEAAVGRPDRRRGPAIDPAAPALRIAPVLLLKTGSKCSS
jgi:hypothetical protein